MTRRSASQETPPIACSLGALEMATREEQWRAVAGASLRSRSFTTTGLRLEFDPGSETAHVLVDLVAAERDCCAWVTWTLTSTAEALVLEADTEPAAVPVLHAMFDGSSQGS